MKLFSRVLSLIIFLSTTLFPQEAARPSYLFTSEEIFKKLDASKVKYEISLTKSEFPVKKYNKISDLLFIKNEGEKRVLYNFELSEEANRYFQMAEAFYQEKRYDDAIIYYKKTLETDNDYHKAYTWIADMYYMKKNFDSAKYYFQLAIEKNPIDYQAHWFLADTYTQLGDEEAAAKQIILAHLFNRNHKDIFDKVKKYNNEVAEWVEWEIAPQCTTYEKDGVIKIETTEGWFSYAMTEALWKYEPGFAKSVIGRDYNENEVSYQQLAGCLYAHISTLKDDEMLYDVVEDGYFEEMVFYELLSRVTPKLMLFLPEEHKERIIQYLNKYHID